MILETVSDAGLQFYVTYANYVKLFMHAYHDIHLQCNASETILLKVTAKSTPNIW